MFFWKKIFRGRENENSKTEVCNSKPSLCVVIIGQDGHGKSTLLSAISLYLNKLGMSQFLSYEVVTKPPIDRSRGFSLAYTQVECKTYSRHYSLIDYVSNNDYVEGLISGHAFPDVAILVVEAVEGVTAQINEHVRLLKKVGVLNIIVVLGKIDLIVDPELLDVVELEIREFLDQYQFPGMDVPVIRTWELYSLLSNSKRLKADDSDFNKIRELIDVLDEYVPTPLSDIEKPFLLSIEDVFGITGRGTVVVGRIERGTVRTGDEVEIIGFGGTRKTIVVGIEMYRKVLDFAQAGDSVGVFLRGIEKTEVQQGMVLAKPESTSGHQRFEAEVFFLKKEDGGRHTPVVTGYKPQFYFRCTEIQGVVQLSGNTTKIGSDESARIEVELNAPLAIEKGLRFAIREAGRVVGAGVVTEILDSTKPSLPKTQSVSKTGTSSSHKPASGFERVAPTSPSSIDSKTSTKRYESIENKSSQKSAELPWKWYDITHENNGNKLLESLRSDLPPIFAAVERSGRDPVFILVDVNYLSWRGLLYLLFKNQEVYYSPEKLCDLLPKQEIVSGETLYKAPVINGKKLKAGIYAVEREALSFELYHISNVPIPLIKQLEATPPKGMFTIAYFCGNNLGVRYISRDARTDKSAPFDL